MFLSALCCTGFSRDLKVQLIVLWPSAWGHGVVEPLKQAGNTQKSATPKPKPHMAPKKHSKKPETYSKGPRRTRRKPKALWPSELKLLRND